MKSNHLVSPVEGPVELGGLREELRDAHRFLVAAARTTVPALADLAPEEWGTKAKRTYIKLSTCGRRPRLVCQQREEHSFTEVVNQCATLERLMDALQWAGLNPELKGAKALRCIPTTSALPKSGARRDVPDHDLIEAERWHFEVSEVASSKDGNRKELKDLSSLQIDPINPAAVWPRARCCLVVSSEFAARLIKPTRHGLVRGFLHYVELKADGATRIIEVRQDRA